METGSKVIEEIQIAREKSLVSWEIKFIEAEDETFIFFLDTREAAPKLLANGKKPCYF